MSNHEEENPNANAASQDWPDPRGAEDAGERTRSIRVPHTCPQPWMLGCREGPIQLCSFTPIQPHHRKILAILNKISDMNVHLIVNRATELLQPSERTLSGPSIADLRKDLVYMLFEKAQYESLYIKEYAKFLRGICNNLGSDVHHVSNMMVLDGSCPYSRDRDLLLPVEELVRLECVKRCECLYDFLKTLYCGLQPWDYQQDKEARDKLVTLMRFMILLFHKSVMPWNELLALRENFARPLEDIDALPHNENDVSHSDQEGITLQALAAEMLAVFMYHFGHLNLADRDGTRQRTQEMCVLLQQRLPCLSTRQKYVVIETLGLCERGWRQSTTQPIFY